MVCDIVYVFRLVVLFRPGRACMLPQYALLLDNRVAARQAMVGSRAFLGMVWAASSHGIGLVGRAFLVSLHVAVFELGDTW